MKEYDKSEYLMISGIQHFSFCRRQWGLIHIAAEWAENEKTLSGNQVHERVHNPKLKEKRKDIIYTRSLKIHSSALGASGECDLVEFHLSEDGAVLPEHKGLYKVFPVEYKNGSRKIGDEDRLQLAAQAICLEEMLATTIDEGAIYYNTQKRRETVQIDEDLKDKVRQCFEEMHGYFNRKYIPKVKYSPKCKRCSLFDLCEPKIKSKDVDKYLYQSIDYEEN